MGGGAEVCLQHASKQLTPLSCLYFLLAQSLKVNHRLSPIQVFPGHVYNPAHACGLLQFQEYARAFPSPCEYFIHQVFLLSVLISLVLAPAGIATPGC